MHIWMHSLGSGETKQSGATFIIAHIGKLCPFGENHVERFYSATKVGKSDEMTDERRHFLSKAKSRFSVSDLLTSPFVYHKLLSCGDWCSLNCTSLDTSDFKISNWCSKHQSLSVFATRLQVIWVSEKSHDAKHLHVLSFAFNWSAFQYHLAIIAQNTALLCAIITLTHTHSCKATDV